MGGPGAAARRAWLAVVLTLGWARSPSEAAPTHRNGTFLKTMIKHQHRQHDSLYDQHRAEAEAEYDALQAQFLALETAAQDMPCTYQLSTEIE